MAWTQDLGLQVIDNSGNLIDFIDPKFVGRTVDGRRRKVTGSPPFVWSPVDEGQPKVAVTRYGKKGLFGSKWDGMNGLSYVQMLRSHPADYSWGKIATEKLYWNLNEVLVLDAEPGRSYFVEWKINEWAFFLPSGRTPHSAFLRSEHEAKDAATNCRFLNPIYIPTGALL